VRPESLKINPAAGPADAASFAPNHLLAEVKSIMYLGDNEQYSLRLADDVMMHAVEHNPTTRKAQVGDRVTLRFDAQAVVVLPEEELGD
jgi:ABC-type Fe3+/spermidine/putrescine transport system ATPase subunit